MSLGSNLQKKIWATTEPTVHTPILSTCLEIFQWNISNQVDCAEILQNIHRYAEEFPYTAEKTILPRPSNLSCFYGALHPHSRVDYFDNLIDNIQQKLLNRVQQNPGWKYRRGPYEIAEKMKFVDFTVGESWITKYSQGTVNNLHNHWNAPFTTVFYPHCDENTTAIYFGYQGEFFIKPQTGTLIIFSGSVHHAVPQPLQSALDRYCFVTNLYSTWPLTLT